MKRTIIIDEDKQERLLGKIFESAFYPKAEQVVEVEKFLDDNFKRKEIVTVNPENGYPKIKGVTVMVKNGVELGEFDGPKLVRLLDDKFHDRIKDDDDRKRFLRQVADDWYKKKIKFGILSVNKI